MPNTLVNLTPYAVTIYGDEGKKFVLEPSGIVCRVQTEEGTRHTGWDKALPANVPVYKADRIVGIVGLPEECSGVCYVVSAVAGAAIAQKLKHRLDVMVLGTGPNDGAIRENGQIVGVNRLKLVN